MECSSFACAQSDAMQVESRSVSRILFSGLKAGAAIIHLAHLLPNGSSDLPGGRKPCRQALLSGGQPYLTPPYLVLHYEEFAWPRVLPRKRRCALTLSPRRGRTVSPITRWQPTLYSADRSAWLVSSLLHLSSPIRAGRLRLGAAAFVDGRPAVSGLVAL